VSQAAHYQQWVGAAAYKNVKGGMLVKEVDFSKKLVRYFSTILPNGKLGFFSSGCTSVIVSDIKKLSKRTIGNQVYSFLLACSDGKLQKRSAFVLKAYGRSLDPVTQRYKTVENLDRCKKEFQVLTSLGRVGFPVPKACFYEVDLTVLSLPFIITEKEELSCNLLKNLDEFAKNLVWLHSLDVDTLGINVLKSPEGGCEFAWRCLLYLKLYLNLYPSQSKGLKRDFELATSWLESNIHMNSCPKYSLIHGDYRANFNAVMTNSSKMVVIDWEDAAIGDPAYDVGTAYARERVDLGKETADRFVQEYLKYHDGDIAERLLFYELLAYLRLAITHNAVLSNPLRAYEIHGPKAFLSFPFFNLPFVAKRVGTDLDIIWVESFKEFVREKLSR